MTTSGDYTYNPAVTNIMTRALTIARVVAPGEIPDAPTYQSTFQALNDLVVQLQADQIHVWTEEEAILFVEPLVDRYLIGGTPTPATHVTAAASLISTTMAIPALAGATTVTVLSAAGMADGDFIGLLGDDLQLFWTTISGTPVGDVVTLADALTVNVSAGAFVFAYTSPIVRPLNIPRARMLQFYNASETPMTNLSRQEYMDLPNKLAPGVPTQWFYTPMRQQGELYLWPTAQNGTVAIRFTWYRPLQTFLTVADTADFPQEWVGPLTWLLAQEIMIEWATPAPVRAEIRAEAQARLEIVKGWDTETQDIQLGMGYPTGRP